ncbi:MAG TPA: prepilin peptidase, partial [Tenericutes bacterium]|nr:prepilin peptidase [Mycoplasmatota bacterium]
MFLYYVIMFFLLGTIFGSFYNVVGYRIPKGESIVSPSSHCPNCNHFLKPVELIPIFSYFIQGGKCKNCKIKISLFYPIFEFLCGILFVLCFVVFGISYELIIALTFISMMIIIILTDYYYMIIPDSVLIVFTILLAIETILIKGIAILLTSLSNALIAFIIMFLIKVLGDKIFKKEAMGGGDVKLMFVFGFIIGWQMSIISIVFASFIALPVSIYILYKKKTNVIPFGPFLCISA